LVPPTFGKKRVKIRRSSPANDTKVRVFNLKMIDLAGAAAFLIVFSVVELCQRVHKKRVIYREEDAEF
jgi:hypothetical protein